MDNAKFQQWSQTLSTLKPFENDDDARKYGELLHAAEGEVDSQVAECLLGLFTDQDDYGLFEQTRNLIALSDKFVVYAALVKMLPTLYQNSQDWAEIILGQEFEYGAPHLLCNYFKKAPQESRQLFKEIITSEEFIANWPKAKKFRKTV